TADCARALGRDVGAVPGQVTSPLAAGPNDLLFDGALVVRDARDVLDLLFGAGARPAPARRDGSQLRDPLRKLLGEIEAGRAFLAETPDRPRRPEVRFDAIGVIVDGAGRLVELEHLEGAF